VLGFTFGTRGNIFWAIFSLGKKYGEGFKEKFNIKADLKIVKGMVKERAGIQPGKYTQEAGKMEKDMDMVLL
jgi:hypothetical protein